MRLIFAGTPVFAERALQAVLDAGHDVALVLTRADQPAGRGQQLQASPVKQLAVARGLPVFQPRTLRDADAQRRIADVGADAMVVAAYGLILPPEVLSAPRLGCINIHASLLPRWRGAAPIQRAIEAGDDRTGITIMQMDAGLDTGAMLLVREVPIRPDDTGASLHDTLADCGATLIVEALDALARGKLVARPQPEDGITYAAKIGKAETQLDWRASARTLADRVRAFDPFPGSVLRIGRLSEPLKLWRAAAETGVEACRAAEPGTVLEVSPEGIRVACGEGVLRLLELQKPGGRRLPVADFLRGFPLEAGERFLVPAG
ncbi:MAG: hypothetical protein RIS35_1141 [Pseudomonadota bacterium]|jgi:methionyl-tRNA formyltransferase